jgi:hypothetical protein
MSPFWGGVLLALCGYGASVQAGEGAWVFSPEAPGANAPPVGRSLFDRVFSATADRRPVYRIPYPFPALLAYLDEHVGREPTGASRLKKTLIPLGRSLQRDAAAPDYFRYPRVVVAVDTEPDAQAPHALVLRDRLFLGYQEKAQSVEIISYNEEAARFEFQVIRGYGPGGVPRVLYANRALCTSCHRNGGPMFAEAPWDETTSNRAIVRHLTAEHASFYGIPANASGVMPPAIDNATNRANLLPALQLVWREGCGADARPRAVRCRGSLLLAMLQYRLSDATHFDMRSARYRDDLLPALAASWEQRWPQGLAIPSPDLPDRKPAADNRVPPELEPSRPRPATAVWHATRARDVAQMVAGLGELLTAAEITALDDALLERGRQAGAPSVDHRVPCALTITALRAGRERVAFDCHAGAHTGGPAASGQLVHEPDGSVRGRLELLRFGAEAFSELELSGHAARGAVDALRVYHKHGLLHARRADGRAVAMFTLRVPEGSSGLVPVGTHAQTEGELILTVMDDFAPVRAAVAALERQTLAGAGILGPQPLYGPRVMAALFGALGLTPAIGCCEAPHPLPPLRVEGEGGAASGT